MIEIPDFDIRFSEMEDQPYLDRWFLDAGACDDFPFDFEERGDALKNWLGFSRFKASLTGTINNVPCAIGTLFLMPYKKVAHHCSFYLIVDPDHRRKGVGTSMVRNLLHLAKSRFRLESVHVEIYEPSKLHSILQKLGFELFARQENYVVIEGCSRARLLLEHYFV
ncbi:MAG TPA: GNAT family N-acetyltransferase [Chlamydiales bacterium]|jgi:putative acetyltransferase|nr:GNAT family N-acetyltransferase [Chlamydiales bacterium]